MRTEKTALGNPENQAGEIKLFAPYGGSGKRPKIGCDSVETNHARKKLSYPPLLAAFFFLNIQTIKKKKCEGWHRRFIIKTARKPMLSLALA